MTQRCNDVWCHLYLVVTCVMKCIWRCNDVWIWRCNDVGCHLW